MQFNVEVFVQNVVAMRDKQKEVVAAHGTNRYWVLVSELNSQSQNVDRLINQYNEIQRGEIDLMHEMIDEKGCKND